MVKRGRMIEQTLYIYIYIHTWFRSYINQRQYRYPVRTETASYCRCDHSQMLCDSTCDWTVALCIYGKQLLSNKHMVNQDKM